MKVISLNIWGGRVKEPLLAFVEQQRDVAVFCFQEVYRKATQQMSNEGPFYALDIFSDLQARLPSYQGFFRPVIGDSYGIGMFVHPQLKVLEEGAIVIHDNPQYPGRGPTHSRNLQWIKMEDPSGHRYAILNVHGLWNGQGKGDSPERLAQSQKIRQFVEALELPTILCGDFNLRPDTQSVALLEDVLHNLIRRYQVVSTRTSLYPKDERFADYIFISPDIEVERFEVLSDEVSDHAPLQLSFNLCRGKRRARLASLHALESSTHVVPSDGAAQPARAGRSGLV